MGNGQFAARRHDDHGIGLKKHLPRAHQRRAPRQQFREHGEIERSGDWLLVAQNGQRAGIALTLGGIPQSVIAVGQPEFHLQVRRLLERRNLGDLLDGPASTLQPLARVGNGIADFLRGLQTIRTQADRRALLAAWAFQRRWHPPRIARCALRHA